MHLVGVFFLLYILAALAMGIYAWIRLPRLMEDPEVERQMPREERRRRKVVLVTCAMIGVFWPFFLWGEVWRGIAKLYSSLRADG